MSTPEATAETLTTGQQLVGLYQEIWRADQKISKDITDSADAAVAEIAENNGGIGEVITFNDARMAEVGKGAVAAYYARQVAESRKATAYERKGELLANLTDLLSGMAGKQAEVKTLGEGGYGIFESWDPSPYKNDKGRYVRTATGTIDNTQWSFDGVWFSLKPPRRHFLKLASSYHIYVINEHTGEPQVSISVED